MIQIVNNDIRRGDVKIGWIEDEYIYDHTGKKIGFFDDNHIFNSEGKKIGYLQDDYIFTMQGSTKIRIEDNLKEVNGGTISDLARAAIRLLLG